MSEKTYDGTKDLGELARIPKERVAEIWDQVRENHKRLESCPMHHFDPIDGEGEEKLVLSRKYVCRFCKGTADTREVWWYRRGFSHGCAAKEET